MYHRDHAAKSTFPVVSKGTVTGSGPVTSKGTVTAFILSTEDTSTDTEG